MSSEANAPPYDDSDDEEFVYPGANVEPLATPPVPAVPAASAAPAPPHPSQAQLEALYGAASSGDLPLLKKLFHSVLQGGDVGAFALANDAPTRTGFTALHAAASRGYLDIVQWRECPSLPCGAFLTPG